MKTLLCAALMALASRSTFAQSADAATPSLTTPPGHEASVGFSHYVYREPGDQSISIHGTKIEGDYTGTLSLNQRQHWFAQVNLRGSIGNVSYDGWCSPFEISPDSGSPNGNALGLGNASPCSEASDKDWYLEGRAIAGKDLAGQDWALAPATGLGLRHLSNGTSGVPGYRSDDYLYLPVILTARTRAAHHVVTVALEYDGLLHGWQKTRDSQLGGGDLPATQTAPAFTIDGFSDVSFSQTGGWGARASAKYQLTDRVSIQPYYIHWSVTASPTADETATFTVNRISARELISAYEPDNRTNEFGVRLGLRF